MFNKYVNNMNKLLLLLKITELENILIEQYNDSSSIHNTSERFDIIFENL